MDPVDRGAAQEKCREQGAELVTIDELVEMEYIQRMLSGAQGGEHLFIGMQSYNIF